MIHVSCAIIELKNQVLICQRSETMNMPLKWEFPGGKIELGETASDALIREISEELNLFIEPTRALNPSTYHYTNFSITLYPFVCEINNGTLQLREHAQAIWVTKQELSNFDWAEADIPVLEAYLQIKSH